jgi:hypothetical protein
VIDDDTGQPAKPGIEEGDENGQGEPLTIKSFDTHSALS